MRAGAVSGRNTFSRGRFKGQSCGYRVALFGACDGIPQHFLVPQVNSIECPNRDNAAPPASPVPGRPVRCRIEDIDFAGWNIHVHREGFRGPLYGRRFRCHFQSQSVIGQFHEGVAGLEQSRIGLLVRQIVGNVCEPGPLGLQAIDQRQRLLHRLMHGMRNIPQRIQNQLIQIFE